MEGFETPIHVMHVVGNNRLALNCQDTFFLIWDPHSERNENLQAVDAEDSVVCCLEGNEDSIFAGCESGALKKFSLENTSNQVALKGHSKKVENLKLIMLDDQEMLVSSGADHEIRVWSATSGNLIYQYVAKATFSSLQYIEEQKRLVGIGPHTEVFNIVTGELLHSFKTNTKIQALIGIFSLTHSLPEEQKDREGESEA